jgi:Uma2 family endonuclease
MIALPANVEPEPERQERLLSAADLAVLPSELPSGPVKDELDDGRLVTTPPPGNVHAAVESNLATELKLEGERRGYGKCRSGSILVWIADPMRRRVVEMRAGDDTPVAEDVIPGLRLSVRDVFAE